MSFLLPGFNSEMKKGPKVLHLCPYSQVFELTLPVVERVRALYAVYACWHHVTWYTRDPMFFWEEPRVKEELQNPQIFYFSYWLNYDHSGRQNP